MSKRERVAPRVVGGNLGLLNKAVGLPSEPLESPQPASEPIPERKEAPKNQRTERPPEPSAVKRLTITLEEGIHSRLYDYLLSRDGLAETAGSPSTFLERLIEAELKKLEKKNEGPFERVLKSVRKRRS